MRKWQKSPFLAYFWQIWAIFGPKKFFLENRASSLFSTPWTPASCKEAKKTYGWKYENLQDGQTDRYDRIQRTQSVQKEWKRLSGHTLCPLKSVASVRPSITEVFILPAIGFLSFFCIKLGFLERRKVTKPYLQKESEGPKGPKWAKNEVYCHFVH